MRCRSRGPPPRHPARREAHSERERGEDAVNQLTGTGAGGRSGRSGRYLYDPDPAVVRAHLVAEFAATVDGTLADPSIAYVYADTAAPTPYARCLEVIDMLPFSLKRLRALLRERGIGRLEILKRGSLWSRNSSAGTCGSRPGAGEPGAHPGRRAPTALLCRPVVASA